MTAKKDIKLADPNALRKLSHKEYKRNQGGENKLHKCLDRIPIICDPDSVLSNGVQKRDERENSQ